MNNPTRRKLQKAGLIISLICMTAGVVMIPQNPPRSTGRLAMILMSVVGFLVSLSFFLQLRQKEE
ncbi:MAG: hypothetical protein MUE37_04660 [Bacteroidales bacterium]|jgi:heme/copper-type cytochrome/quinol oxidase subunit 4|nr:hypothetical protein [Bacteroidales bacterium]